LEFGLLRVSIGKVHWTQSRNESMKYKLDLVGVQEVRCGEDIIEPADDYTLFAL